MLHCIVLRCIAAPARPQVFTTAASDESPQIVRLAFDTVEKIVREHFNHITGKRQGRVVCAVPVFGGRQRRGGTAVGAVLCFRGNPFRCQRCSSTHPPTHPPSLPPSLPPPLPPAETETTTFTDCVNCLIAFTNNPHSLDVSLNAIAFLRFCAMALAEGDIGELEELPEGSLEAAGRQMDPNAYRIRWVGGRGWWKEGRGAWQASAGSSRSSKQHFTCTVVSTLRAGP